MALLPDGSFVYALADHPWLPSANGSGDAMKILHVDEDMGQVVFVQRFGQGTRHLPHTHHGTAVAYTLQGTWRYDGHAIPQEHVAFEPRNSVHTPMTWENETSDVLVVLTTRTGRLIELHLPDGRSFDMDIAFFRKLSGMTAQDWLAWQAEIFAAPSA
jgi:hypothetical protein